VTRSFALRLSCALLIAVAGGCDAAPKRLGSADVSSVELPTAPPVATVTSSSSTATASASAAERKLIGGTPVDEQTLIEAPVISVKNGALRLDEELVLNEKDLAAFADKLQRIEPLLLKLRGNRSAWRELRPSKEFPGVVIIDVADSTPAMLVKSVFQTAAFAGYPNVKFVVKTPPASSP
jgi:hypothetical protein